MILGGWGLGRFCLNLITLTKLICDGCYGANVDGHAATVIQSRQKTCHLIVQLTIQGTRILVVAGPYIAQLGQPGGHSSRCRPHQHERDKILYEVIL